jgi:hypothetical protein
VVAAQMKMLQ